MQMLHSFPEVDLVSVCHCDKQNYRDSLFMNTICVNCVSKLTNGYHFSVDFLTVCMSVCPYHFLSVCL